MGEKSKYRFLSLTKKNLNDGETLSELQFHGLYDVRYALFDPQVYYNIFKKLVSADCCFQVEKPFVLTHNKQLFRRHFFYFFLEGFLRHIGEVFFFALRQFESFASIYFVGIYFEKPDIV